MIGNMMLSITYSAMQCLQYHNFQNEKPLKSVKEMEKLERGSTDVVTEKNANITFVRWKDNKEKKECYDSGDFNIDLLKCDTINQHAEFLNTLRSLGFLPHILQTTRITEHSSTIIDNIYGNNFTQETFGGNILITFADHFSQFLSIKKKVLKEKPKVVYKRDYSSFVETDFIDGYKYSKLECKRVR